MNSLSESEYVLRPMTMDDYDELIALWRTSEGMSRLETRAELAAYLARNPGLSQVVHYRGELVAAVLAGHDGHRGYLYHLAVAVAHRRQGLARQLVDHCLKLLGALGLPRCGLHVYRSNASGIEFWRRSGWDLRDDVVAFTHDL